MFGFFTPFPSNKDICGAGNTIRARAAQSRLSTLTIMSDESVTEFCTLDEERVRTIITRVLVGPPRGRIACGTDALSESIGMHGKSI